MAEMKGLNTKQLRYIEKWMIYAVLIGIVAGLGSIVFYFLLHISTAFFLGSVSGYNPTLPAGESSIFAASSAPFRLWMLALIPAIGGLIAGLLIYTFAPEAEGHGTDAVIDAFHNKKGEIRKRVPLIKTIASAITIGSGGSAGREGPIAQIGGGFGSFLASRLKLSDRDRRQMVVCGAAAGIGSIFRAPFGGALFGIEVLYKRDFEISSMIPAVISSVVAYTVFASFPYIGWGPLFETHAYTFNHPVELIFYAILGIACAAVGILYVKVFYGTRNIFRRLKVPNHLKPAIGGVMLGILALLIGYWNPQALDGILGMGYGAVQLAIYGKLSLLLMFIIGIAKIFSTSFTIGSGGSGGVFAPSLVIGALLGGLFGGIFHFFFPEILTASTASAFVLVGMAAFFSAAAKVPIASILMISEMAGSYSLLVPLMLASAVAYVLTSRWTIYEKQVEVRRESPAHRREFMVDIFEGIKVEEACVKDVITIPYDMSVEEAIHFAEEAGHIIYPVVKEGKKLIGTVSSTGLEKEKKEGREKKKVEEVCTKEVIVTYPDEFLEDVLHKMWRYKIGKLPVVKREGEGEEKEVIGIITRADIIRAHERYHEMSK